MRSQGTELLEDVCLLCGLLLLSCSAPYRRYRVDGVADDFCIPKVYATKAEGWWLAAANESFRGFSVQGCDSLPENTMAACTLPEQLVSTMVVPLMATRPVLWRELKEHSSVFNANATYSVDDATGLLVVKAPKAWPSWIVWKRRGGDARDSSGMLHDLDERFADCSRVEDYPGVTAIDRRHGQYVCDRYVRGPDYALDLTFTSKQRVPSEPDLKRIEIASVAQIDRWRCRKQP